MFNLTKQLTLFYKNHLAIKKLITKSSAFIIERCQGYRTIHSDKQCSVHLNSRSLVRLHGKDTAEFLQGLITNDVHNLVNDQLATQYNFMLNVQGRILYDLFLYHVTGKDQTSTTLFVDVQASAVEEFITILKRYKLRRKVDIANVSDEFKVWSQFQLDATRNADYSNDPILYDAVVCGRDPRVPAFGQRLINPANADDERGTVNVSVYRESRYRWGIPEGSNDLPPGNCFPLESNGIFMNAVNFQKGCYIGQELTARTHHTGVTRKRLMPLVFKTTPPNTDANMTIQNEKGRNAGKVRGTQGSFGLGLVRLAHINENLYVTLSDDSHLSLTTHFPNWWPDLDL